MSKLIQCIPNFSEGRRPEVIEEIVAAITASGAATLLDKEMDPDHNRAVVTFVCHPDHVVDAAFAGIAKASELIDMSVHSGEHPRMGSTDVCPFVPLEGVSIDDAVTLANQLGARVGKELDIPVYLYEDAAKIPGRKNLAKIRRGQYEGIRDEIETVETRKPDYGPSKMNIKAGATAIGVRLPLVAYNVYLGTNDLAIAQKIADSVRHLRGGLRFVKAIGFEIKERNQVQVSMNLVNYTKTPIHRVFEMIKSEAARYGVNVTSSELVGLAPNQAFLDVADFYLRLENFSSDQILENKLKSSVSSAESGSGFAGADFIGDVASSAPAPGGGSVSAAAGALSAALGSMVCRLTVRKKAYADVRDELMEICGKTEDLRKKLTELISKDKEAFEEVMRRFDMPKSNDDQIAKRNHAIEEATKEATRVPLEVVENSLEALKCAQAVTEKGNKNSITDAGVAALMAFAAIHGAAYNCKINLAGLGDKKFNADVRSRLEKALAEAEKINSKVKNTVNESFIAQSKS